MWYQKLSGTEYLKIWTGHFSHLNYVARLSNFHIPSVL
uniref:Uncharacterized protein n=1 Tax=Setaria italica TaxID=4555 RepID=K3Z275_SETIT